MRSHRSCRKTLQNLPRRPVIPDDCPPVGPGNTLPAGQPRRFAFAEKMQQEQRQPYQYPHPRTPVRGSPEHRTALSGKRLCSGWKTQAASAPTKHQAVGRPAERFFTAFFSAFFAAFLAAFFTAFLAACCTAFGFPGCCFAADLRPFDNTPM